MVFKDAVPKDKIPEIIHTADAFLFHLADYEIFKHGINPNKLIDYLSAGKPIIYGANSGDKIVEKIGCGVTFVPSDHDSMTSAILKVYNLSKEDRYIMGNKGREFVRNNYDIDKTIEKLVGVLLRG